MMKPVLLILFLMFTAMPFAAKAQDAIAPASPDAAAPVLVSPPIAADGSIVPIPVPMDNAVSAMLSPNPASPIEKGIGDQVRLLSPQIDVNLMPSLFYSTWEHDLIIDARRGIVTGTAIVDDSSLTSESAPRIAGPRDISLNGIVYANSKDWTIWLNGIRVTPKAIPQTVMNLKVFKEYIELDWFDTSTNQIFPIRLRSHQRFNLDTRIFLPG